MVKVCSDEKTAAESAMNTVFMKASGLPMEPNLNPLYSHSMRSLGTATFCSLLLSVMAPSTRSCWSSRPGPLPIASVSVQKVLADANAGQAAKQTLEAMRQSKTDELKKKKEALDVTRRAIADPALSPSARQELVGRALRQEGELQDDTQ